MALLARCTAFILFRLPTTILLNRSARVKPSSNAVLNSPSDKIRSVGLANVKDLKNWVAAGYRAVNALSKIWCMLRGTTLRLMSHVLFLIL